MVDFRFVNNCGVNNRTIFSFDGGRTIRIGCTTYTPEEAIKAVKHKYHAHHKLKCKHIQAIRYISGKKYVLNMDEFNWDEYSCFIEIYAPELLNFRKGDPRCNFFHELRPYSF